MTYETGDNTVVTVDTATVPMDMYYSRATNFGDDWDVVDWLLPDNTTEERWDWLEHGPEISEEASVYGNSDGSKFYAFWTQELEVDYEVFTDIDVEFRRIFFNLTDTDAYPTASLMYVSSIFLDQSANDVLTLIGTGRDWDRMGEGNAITSVEWLNEDGTVLCTDCENTIQILATDLETGHRQIDFRVQDNEGNWSKNVTLDVYVYEQLNQLFLPSLTP